MRACPLCKSTFADAVNVCPVDGTALSRPAGLDATATIAPPGGNMLPFGALDHAERSDGVPRPSRTRGSGRIVVENDAEKTRRDRPPRRRDTDPVDPPPMSLGPDAAFDVSDREETSELERQDFSALLSSGNAVVLEEQTAKAAETALAYQLTSNLYRKYLGMVRSALGHQQS